MPRARQLSLALPHTHGGRRRGAGRPNRSGLQAHRKRPTLNPRHPLHVTLRLEAGLPSLRKKEVFRALCHAVKLARQQGLRIAHFAILSNHVHLIVEPQGAAISKALQSFGISLGKRINALAQRKGRVFRERYHFEILATPTQVKNALNYVLTNEARHRGSGVQVKLDPFSSATAFKDWKRLTRSVEFLPTTWPDSAIEAWLSEILSPPRSWLLTQGWQRARALTHPNLRPAPPSAKSDT
jgi:REP element-mobilizing transposase RayT